jgi:hypothetical protein
MTVDRARQNILAKIVEESARLWKEKNPEALPFGWTAVTEWKAFGTSKARIVRDPSGRGHEQVIGSDGRQTRHRSKEHDDTEAINKTYNQRKSHL